MKRRLLVARSAASGLSEAFDYPAARNVEAAVRLHTAVTAVIQTLPDLPFRGPGMTADPNGPYRRVVVPGFAHCVLHHVITSDTITVTRVPHATRDVPHRIDDGDAG